MKIIMAGQEYSLPKDPNQYGCVRWRRDGEVHQVLLVDPFLNRAVLYNRKNSEIVNTGTHKLNEILTFEEEGEVSEIPVPEDTIPPETKSLFR